MTNAERGSGSSLCVLRSISSLLALVAVGWAAEFPLVPGWSLSGEGLRPKFPSADLVQFTGQFRLIAPLAPSPGIRVYRLDSTGYSPTKLRVNAFASGPEFLFERGFRLRLGALNAPRLSWAEGSVDAGVPTAPSRWVTFSYQDSQPPVLMTFSEPVSLVVSGKVGNWEIRTASQELHKGWVRFALPMGTRALNTSDVSALGLLVQSIRQHEGFWSGLSPQLKGLEVQRADGGVSARWIFDRPGAAVPPPALLSWRGGYRVGLEPDIRHLDAPREDGPVAYSSVDEIRCFFPIRPLAAGRSIITGQGPMPPNLDAVGFAFRAQLADFRPDSRNWASLKPFDSLLISHGISSDSVVNQLSALASTRDLQTWKLPNADRFAEAKVALGGALADYANAQLQGALSQAVLAAENGLHAFFGRETRVPEPFGNERAVFYSPVPTSPFEPMFRSPYRKLSGPPIRGKLAGNSVVLDISAGTAAVILRVPRGYDLVSTTLDEARLASAINGEDLFILGRADAKKATQIVVRNPNGKSEPLPGFTMPR